MKITHFTISCTITVLLTSLCNAGLISHTDYTAGSVITSAGQNANENTIVNEFNGNINSANIAANGVANSNLAANAVTNPKITDATITAAKLENDLQSGWFSSTMTWTYVSASTFTLPGDFTGRFSIGDKIKLTQTTVKYFYVIKSTYTGATSLTSVMVTAGNDYTLANAAITSPYLSHSDNPTGFPQDFALTPLFGSGWGTPTTVSVRFGLIGNKLHEWGKFTTGTTASATGSISIPPNIGADVSKIPNGDVAYVGPVFALVGSPSTLSFGGSVAIMELSGGGSLQNVITEAHSAGSGSFSPGATGGMFGNTVQVYFDATLPVIGF